MDLERLNRPGGSMALLEPNGKLDKLNSCQTDKSEKKKARDFSVRIFRMYQCVNEY